MEVPIVDLWLETLNANECSNQNYWHLLNVLEQSKAMRFVHGIDRRRYIVSHGKLRQILATYLQVPAEEIVLTTQVHGKPFVVGDEAHGIKFNMAHSGDYLAVGVTYGYEIGIDIEAWTDKVDYEAVIELCFASSERSFWQDLPSKQKKEFFYRLWTRKESFVKAVGLGLGLDVATVLTGLTGQSRFLSLSSEFGMPEDWRLIDLELSDGLSGAVTVPNGVNPAICYRRL